MKLIKFTFTLFLATGLISCNNKSKQNNESASGKQGFNHEEITMDFDLSKGLLIDLMMNIPSAVYTNEGKGQYSILYVPKTKEGTEKYKDFENKNNIRLIKDSSGNLFYDVKTAEKIDEILRKDMDINDFCLFGRYIPAQYLVADTLSAKDDYSITMPYEMLIYKLNGNEWKLLKQVVITDIMNYDYYQTLSTYQKLMEKKED
ncbi:MAG: hypothetical protein LBR26_06490 [Prevotella sp.]|jgi:hypothetical protein|nr:hypothetical protein [Prevotella sp.]